MNKSFPVLCVNSGVVYPSAVAAARAHNLTEPTLSKHLSGIHRTCGHGLIFIRLSGSESDDEIAKIRKDALNRIYGIEV